MPKILMPTSTPACLDYAQVAMPMIHPVTGQNYQQLQMADERPYHSRNTADSVRQGFWWHRTRQSEDGTKRGKLNFCDDSQ
jgi:hypothetical protein